MKLLKCSKCNKYTSVAYKNCIYCGSPLIMHDASQVNSINSSPTHYSIDVIKNQNTYSVSSLDGMEGHTFEYFCADLLKKIGYSNVRVTPASGDQGVDILAEKNSIRYAIQCKNYSSKLGNTPIQEVNSGKIYYNCHVGVVMTNSTFTAGAKDLAAATNVLLWDRSILQSFLDDPRVILNDIYALKPSNLKQLSFSIKKQGACQLTADYKMEVQNGVWRVGKDFPAGTWTIEPQDSYALIFSGNTLNPTGRHLALDKCTNPKYELLCKNSEQLKTPNTKSTTIWTMKKGDFFLVDDDCKVIMTSHPNKNELKSAATSLYLALLGIIIGIGVQIVQIGIAIGGFYLTLAFMSFILSKSPILNPYILGKTKGITKTAFQLLCILLAIAFVVIAMWSAAKFAP